MRGTLLPSVKVARMVSNWPSTPKMPLANGTTSHCQASSAPRKMASRWDKKVCSNSPVGPQVANSGSQKLPVGAWKMKLS